MQHSEAYYRELLSGFILDTVTSEQVRELYHFIEREPATYERLMNESDLMELIEEKAGSSSVELLPQADARIRERLMDYANNLRQEASDENVPRRVPTHRVHFLKTSWFRYAAAVILLLGGAALVRVFTHRNNDLTTTNGNKHLQTDIAPGGDKAVLTLADGTKIVLDNAQNGNLAQQGGTKVIKLDAGQLAYNTGNPPGPLYKGEFGKEILYNTISTPRGGQYQIVLPDGSKVWLNAASSIKFPTSFSSGTREVEMTGEVYMEIAKNSKQPFVVKANGTEVHVLGTSFNINAYVDEEAIRTTLVEGSVKVIATTDHGQQITVLRPGQQCTVVGGQSSVVNNADIDQTLAWKNGLFSFSGADINTIMRQLSRWYDVEVIYEGAVPDRHFLGEMRRNMSLAAVLRVLERSNVHFSVEGKKIIVKP